MKASNISCTEMKVCSSVKSRMESHMKKWQRRYRWDGIDGMFKKEVLMKQNVWERAAGQTNRMLPAQHFWRKLNIELPMKSQCKRKERGQPFPTPHLPSPQPSASWYWERKASFRILGSADIWRGKAFDCLRRMGVGKVINPKPNGVNGELHTDFNGFRIRPKTI